MCVWGDSSGEQGKGNRQQFPGLVQNICHPCLSTGDGSLGSLVWKELAGWSHSENWGQYWLSSRRPGEVILALSSALMRSCVLGSPVPGLSSALIHTEGPGQALEMGLCQSGEQQGHVQGPTCGSGQSPAQEQSE